MDEVTANIRACLISTKGKISVRQLESDYRTLLGERIPYTQLGCKSVQEFISKIPSLSVTKNNNGEWFVDAKASDKSNHITDMVNKQKAGKKKPPPKVLRNKSYSKVPQTRNWSPANINYKPRRFKTSERTAAVSHNQLISRSPTKSPYVSVKSRLVIPEYSSFKNSNSTAPVNSTVSVKPADTHQAKQTAPVNGVLLNTPLRASYVHKPVSSDTASVSSRLKMWNFQESLDVKQLDTELLDNSLLQNSRKRLTRMMSEVSLDRDSGNSSPTNETKGLPCDIILTDDPIKDLKTIVNYYKLGKIDVSHVPMIPKKRNAPTIHTCTIMVDGKSYLSYPENFLTPKEAEEYCAKKALEDVMAKCTRKKALLLSTSKDIKERIPPMLLPHFQGVWSTQIEEDYADKYMEQLPLNWLEIIDSSDCVAVERMHDRYVLKYCRPGTRGEKFNISLPLDVSIPSNTVQFGEGNRLFAQITCMMSLNEVWCRQWDTLEFEQYNEMILMMETYYNQKASEHKVDLIQLGSYYVANYDMNWYRVRALEIRDKDVNCFLIDFGDEYCVDKNDLYHIRREFATSQAQAFVSRLAGLEDLYDANVSPDYFTTYVGKEVILEATQSDTEDTNTDQSIAVVMYDFNSGNSLNEELLKFLTIEIATPTLKPNILTEVCVSHLTEDGFVYVQIHSKGFLNLQNLLEVLEEEMEQNPPVNCREKIDQRTWLANKDRLYLSQDMNDGHWYRSKILDMSPNGEFAQVYYVDKGNFNVTPVADIVMYPLDKISDVLDQFPVQSVKIKMALDVVPENFVDLASKVMKIGSFVLLKVVGNDDDGVQIGEFHKRSIDEGLFCINKSITMELEISSKHEDDNILKGTRSKLVKLTQLKDESIENVPSGGSLLSPTLPEKGHYFGVVVPFVVNPWNFFVQPHDSSDELNEMMNKLQKYYKNTTVSPLQMKNIIPGQIYATKHTDNIWYRVSVLKVIHTGSISVFYCDFGYYASLRVDQLVPLDSQFTVLPYQALKARLSGIKPKKSKWSMEDCTFFSEMVCGKSFMSVLIDIEKDELYESDPVLKLTLIDTSTDEDIFIDHELIKLNIAIEAD